MLHKRIFGLLLGALAVAVPVTLATVASAHRARQARTAQHPATTTVRSDANPATTTPIKHLVVIFQENVSFDHYFGTYPNASNPAGEPAFHARPGTPTVNGLSGPLLTNNPNLDNPQRLDRSQ